MEPAHTPCGSSARAQGCAVGLGEAVRTHPRVTPLQAAVPQASGHAPQLPQSRPCQKWAVEGGARVGQLLLGVCSPGNRAVGPQPRTPR